jgi:hypothetical protein
VCYGEDLGPDWTRFPIAGLHYTKTTGPWARYWRDRNLNTTAANLSIPAHPPVQTFSTTSMTEPITSSGDNDRLPSSRDALTG